MDFSEIDRGNILEGLFRSNLADILTPLVAMTRKWPRPACVQRYFDSFGIISRNLGDISQPQRLYTNSRRLWFSVKRREEYSGRHINSLSDYD